MIRPTLHRAVYIHEAERALQLDAQPQTDALLARVRQPEPVQMCAVESDEPARWTLLDKLGLAFLIVLGMFGCWLCGWLA